MGGLNHKVTSSRQLAWRDLINRITIKENKLANLSMIFAINSLELSKDIQGHYSLKQQFERSSTSIGANIREANYTQSGTRFYQQTSNSIKKML